MTDVIADLGPVFLGSRLKRLAERFQGSAARIIADAGLPVQPSHMPLLTALASGPTTVGQLVDMVGTSQPGITRSVGQLVALGLVTSERGTDQRERRLSLTGAGERVMTQSRALIWPRVEAAVGDLCASVSGGFLEQVAALEAALTAEPLESRVARAPRPKLSLVEYDDSLAPLFHDLNAEWIAAMFSLEPTDRDVLENPRTRIIEPGGAILFVEVEGLGVVGTCALQKTGEGRFELTKMAVRDSARGMKAGAFLLKAMLDRAAAMDVRELYLLSNRRCAAAVHLYEKAGFRHDPEIMARYGARYERCDVAMRYHGPLGTAGNA
ncbi:bifunctional helix-turn-helix transcriptional regulator/GNAT family N-acetyltransferase [Sphingosinicella sp. BN140058]|uniref:bifunctional helix-turn-helix transcriptional regulator/GNAT family N-acetyltransferase n=1 Tax=Sphingosinicella sp. BN140058 TaxID=1892855 RepID=UPI0010108365|nr:bifunctional helix-turn-helix transcriptional regulator/GNAT family N-acetyltransferase [Sphingosinicella sp. BN140058]QAY78781.1 GNAT family N-acetyltransferase [Sphingosinicella sp. BN140058]